MNAYRKADDRIGRGPELPKAELKRLVRELQKRFGLLVTGEDKDRLYQCIANRARLLGMHSQVKYLKYLLDSEASSDELILLLDNLTDSRSNFFHYSGQFEFLAQIALPELIKQHGAGISRKLIIWSAGCTSGEEPYSLAMVIRQFSEHYPGIRFSFQILATDVSYRMLEKAARAVYEMDQVNPIPVSMKKKFLLKSKDSFKRQVRVSLELRDQVAFRQLDFLNPRFALREKMDAIFCRDVIRYFDNPSKERLIHRLCHYLLPGGYLFLGELETLEQLDVALIPVGPGIYRLPA